MTSFADAVPFTSGQEAATEALAHRSMAGRGSTGAMMIANRERRKWWPARSVISRAVAGYLVVTPGDETDFDEIEKQTCGNCAAGSMV